MKPARASSEDLRALLARWVAHKQNGNLAFSRAIFRSYTRESLFGRLVRRHVVLNPLAPMLLKDAIEATGECRPLDPPFVADSSAAAALLAQAPPRIPILRAAPSSPRRGPPTTRASGLRSSPRLMR